MRIIDLHCYTNTAPWIAAQGPYVEALSRYWGRDWKPKEKQDRRAAEHQPRRSLPRHFARPYPALTASSRGARTPR